MFAGHVSAHLARSPTTETNTSGRDSCVASTALPRAKPFKWEYWLSLVFTVEFAGLSLPLSLMWMCPPNIPFSPNSICNCTKLECVWDDSTNTTLDMRGVAACPFRAATGYTRSAVNVKLFPRLLALLHLDGTGLPAIQTITSGLYHCLPPWSAFRLSHTCYLFWNLCTELHVFLQSV